MTTPMPKFLPFFLAPKLIATFNSNWFNHDYSHAQIFAFFSSTKVDNMGYAISIHNSQGKGMDNLIANIGSNEFANGLTYTALSRVRKFENIYFEPFFNFDRFDKDIRKQKMFIERIAHEKKEKESDEKFCDKVINWYYDDVAINPDDTD